VRPGGLVFICGLLAAFPAATAPLTFRQAAKVDRRQIGLADVADLSSLPPELRRGASQLVVAALRPEEDQASLPAQRLAERARALMPALDPWLGDTSAHQVSVRYVGPATLGAPPRLSAGCRRVLTPLAPGAIPLASDFEPAACEGARIAFRYDPASGVARSLRDLQAGEVVVALPDSAVAGLRPGARLHLQTHVGPVRVDRTVEAVLPTRRGEAMFVRASDGVVFAVATSELHP
jgi:hypothetical protein